MLPLNLLVAVTQEVVNCGPVLGRRTRRDFVGEAEGSRELGEGGGLLLGHRHTRMLPFKRVVHLEQRQLCARCSVNGLIGPAVLVQNC